jgi:hypothetical protein
MTMNKFEKLHCARRCEMLLYAGAHSGVFDALKQQHRSFAVGG